MSELKGCRYGFYEKLQELRKIKGLTQEELAEHLHVSRTAISKWESGRGYPNIDSLKAISKFYGVTLDELLSGDELLTIAEEDTKRTENRYRDLVFGVLGISVSMLLFLPFFGQNGNGAVQSVSLLALTNVAPYLKALYYVVVVGAILSGILTLALQNCGLAFWTRCKGKLPLTLDAIGVFLFVISQQAYAAVFLLVILSIKVMMLMKWH